ncbi:MAG: FAD-dependent oxidoreductase, partial [Bacteriovoracales bacterium]|nr:FAD-dependent oxidoreductase [Bacteriovoracales bacterium]
MKKGKNVKILQVTLPYDRDLHGHLAVHFPHIEDYRIRSRSLDARGVGKGRPPRYHYVLEYREAGDEPWPVIHQNFVTKKKFSTPPLIVGAGPAGLFCALRFAEYGIPTRILERGDTASKRMHRIAKFWRYGELDEETNVCFGEGGAGLFSDGKLVTRIKSPFVSYVMKKFIDYGAPEELAWVSAPHLGSHKIRKMISSIGQDLKRQGSRIECKSKVVGLIFEDKGEDKGVRGVVLESGERIRADHVILATGHSAMDIYLYCRQNGIALEARPFSVGVRIEHSREALNRIQYGSFPFEEKLGASSYRLSWEDPQTMRSAYSFCMCPGGYVLSSGTQKDGLVTNGMSNDGHNSPWSNGAIVAQVQSGRDFTGDHVLAGAFYREAIEKKAFELSKLKATGRELPAMYVGEFLEGRSADRPLPPHSSPSGIFRQDLREILPMDIVDHLKKALKKFDQKIAGFASCDRAILIAPETRTSAPVAIARNPFTLVSLSHQGLYPCGEGAGYAGGITSAAVDGVRVCEAILHSSP